MKKKILALLLASVGPILGGTIDTTTPVDIGTINGIEQFANTIFAAHAVSVVLYPSWDPYITVGGVKKPYGFGGAILYPVSEYAFAGIRVDFLGNTYWAPSAVVGAKYKLKNLPGQPTVFTISGLLLPVSGAGSQNAQAQAVTGLGFTFTFLHNKANTMSLNGFCEGEKITNFDGINTHLGIAGGLKF